MAVKTIGRTDPDLRARFAREVTATLQVASPYTARVIDADLHAPVPYLASEYVAGETLTQRIARTGPLTGDELDTTLAGVAAGLAAIHQAGVVHRDLSPSNVILAVDGPRIIDLGIAVPTGGPTRTALTATGTTIGTVGTMAPEQVRGRSVGPPADVFAWGALVVHAATGRAVFGTSPADAVLYRVVHEPADLTGVPDRLAGHAAAALDKDPAARPAALDLARALAGQPGDLDAVTAAIATRTAATAGPGPTLASATRPEHTWPQTAVDPHTPTRPHPAPPEAPNRRRRWLTAAAGLAAVAVAGTAATVAARSGPTDPPTTATTLPDTTPTPDDPAGSPTSSPASAPADEPGISPGGDGVGGAPRPDQPDMPWTADPVPARSDGAESVLATWAASDTLAGCTPLYPSGSNRA